MRGGSVWFVGESGKEECFREEERELNVSIVEVRKEVINWFILL